MKKNEISGFWDRLLVLLLAASLAPIALAACTSMSPDSPVQLNQGQYTPLGSVTKSTQPTASDLADMQAAESGTLNEPALVEFYADN